MKTTDGEPDLSLYASPNRRLIDLRSSTHWPRWLPGPVVGSVEKLLAIDQINAIHQNVPQNTSVQDFCENCLSHLNINYSVTDEELSWIPTSGPLVLVANHPFGGIEGILLAALLLQVRPDVRILGNYLLTQIPALAPSIIAVDPFAPKKAARANARALKKAMDWVSAGGALLTFPSGEVSHWDYKSTQVTDPPWSPHIAKIIMKAKAKTLPVFIHGRNTLWFNLMGLIHPMLRTMLLPRELTNKRNRNIALEIGQPIIWRKLSEFASSREVVEFLRFNTYLLKHRSESSARKIQLPIQRRSTKPEQVPIIAPVPKAKLTAEIEALSEEQRLVTQKEFDVYLTTAEESPAIMREIARLRELSFREVDEGTGRCMDRDDFDDYYLQLLLWNRVSSEIVGAYRMGQTDLILEDKGTRGLYSSTLFSYETRFLSKMGNSLELGRSFIRTEYQKKFGCLAIMWRGIGEFVVRNRQYRHLFGPVSISQSYHAISKNLMVAFLNHHSMDPKLAPLVKPRRPFKARQPVDRSVPFSLEEIDAIEEISMLVSRIEKDNKGVPTLIKHYLKLNGKFLAFNLDKAFANVIDGLVLVDLVKTEPKILRRFMDAEGANAFLAHHCADQDTEAA